MLLRLALREIINSRRFAAAFVFNLALGLLGFVILQTFKGALDRSLSEKSRLLLSADLSVSARRALTPDETRAVNQLLARYHPVFESRVTELYSMVRAGKQSRLTQIAAIDEKYPLYGAITLGPRSSEKLFEADVAWLDPTLALQLGVGVGDVIELGEKKFRVAGIISDDTSSTGFSFAPRLYVGADRLKGSGLLERGSTVTQRRLIRIPPQAPVDELVQELGTRIPDPGVSISSHKNASEQVGRTISYLNDYLGLVALVALFLASLGAVYLFRSFLARRLEAVAILMSLGMKPLQTVAVYIAELVVLGLASAALSVAVGAVALPPLERAISPYIPIPLSLNLDVVTVALCFGLSVLLSLVVSLPLLGSIAQIRPIDLFHGLANPSKWRMVALSLPSLGLFWGLSVWQAHSFRVGSFFLTVLLISGFIIAALTILFLRMLSPLSERLSFTFRQALKTLAGYRMSSAACVLSLALAALLLNVLPQLRKSLESELTRPDGEPLPSLFLFDIQEEQIEALKAQLHTENKKIFAVSPMVRARLSKLNGEPVERVRAENAFATREAQQEIQSRNRGYNLTFRTELTPSERVISGQWFEKRFDPATDPLPGISVESRMAKRMGLKLGDRLTFDIQGIEVEGQVQSLRRVRWTSFMPNFFFAFQPGALDEAPKTYLGAVEAMPTTEKVALQNRLLSRFSNISIIDVTSLVERLLTIFGQMSLALLLMAVLALVAATAVLFSIARHQAMTRRRDLSLLKTLGASVESVTLVILKEFLLIGSFSALLGAGLSIVVGYVLSVVVFEGVWAFEPWVPLFTVIGVSALSVITAYLAAKPALNEKPLALLQSE